MRKFAYMVVEEITQTKLQDKLNMLGEQGWELVSVIRCPKQISKDKMGYFTRAYLKNENVISDITTKTPNIEVEDAPPLSLHTSGIVAAEQPEEEAEIEVEERTGATDAVGSN